MYYISAGQTSLLQVQGEFTLAHVLIIKSVYAITEMRKAKLIGTLRKYF